MSQLYNEIKSLRRRIKGFASEKCANKIKDCNINDLRTLNYYIAQQSSQIDNYMVRNMSFGKENKTIMLEDNSGEVALPRN